MVDRENLTKFKFINCICCRKKIELVDQGFLEYNEKVDPESAIWKDGVVMNGSAGYGSIHDGGMYYIGICDECVANNLHDGRIIYYSNYLSSDEDPEIEKYQKLRNRANNLDDLIE